MTLCMAVLENGRSFTGLVFFDPGTSRHIADEGRLIRTKYLFFCVKFRSEDLEFSIPNVFAITAENPFW